MILRTLVFLAGSVFVSAQTYQPMTGDERAKWFVKSTYGPTSLFVAGPITSGFRTATNSPKEWGPGWEGYGRRYGARLLANSLTNGVEGGFGAIWHEDPRYFVRGSGSIKSRLGEALKQTFLSRYGDGKYRFGAAKAMGVVGGAWGQNLWMPDSVDSTRSSAARIGTNYAGRLVGNLFTEFGSDLKRILRRK